MLFHIYKLEADSFTDGKEVDDECAKFSSRDISYDDTRSVDTITITFPSDGRYKFSIYLFNGTDYTFFIDYFFTVTGTKSGRTPVEPSSIKFTDPDTGELTDEETKNLKRLKHLIRNRYDEIDDIRAYYDQRARHYEQESPHIFKSLVKLVISVVCSVV